jgi:hypothetical protein
MALHALVGDESEDVKVLLEVDPEKSLKFNNNKNKRKT